MAISLSGLGVALKRLNSNLAPLLLAPPVPVMLATTTTGGSMPATTVYAYRTTYVIGGVETAASPEVTITTGTGSTNSVTITVPPMPGASIKIYGRTASSELLLTTLSPGTYSYVDTGSGAPAGALPSASGFSEATLYTVASGKVAKLDTVRVSNPTAFTAQAFLSIVPSGGSPARILAGGIVYPDAMQSRATEFDVGHLLNAGDVITGYVTVPGVNLFLLGSELGA